MWVAATLVGQDTKYPENADLWSNRTLLTPARPAGPGCPWLCLFPARSARARTCAGARGARWAGVAPGRLGGQDPRRACHAGRQDLVEAALLPLEDDCRHRAVLAQRVELYRALDAVQLDPAVQVVDDLGVVGAMGGSDRLREHLAHRVRLGHVGVDARRAAAVQGDVLPDHLLARHVLISGIPAVGHHNPVFVTLADRGDERGALVRPGCRDE